MTDASIDAYKGAAAAKSDQAAAAEGDWRNQGALSAKALAGYAPGLDGIRAIAVMIVMVAHFGFAHIVPGGFGVTIFFFISGFLITRLLIAEQNDSGLSLPRFYARRALRLMPALIVFLALSTIMLAPRGIAPTALEATAALFYFTNYFTIAHLHYGVESHMPWGHLWSLAVEEHFYLFYPLTFALLRRRATMIAFVTLVLAGCLIWRVLAVYGLHLPLDHNYMASDTRLDSIGWGCLLALMLDGAARSALIRLLIGFWPSAFAAALFLLAFALRDDNFRETIRYSIQGVALFIGVLNLFFWHPLRPAVSILDIPALRFVGRLSYSLYLWHMPFSDVWAYPLHDRPVLYFIVGFSGSFGVACASYFIVERPLLSLRRKLGSHAKA